MKQLRLFILFLFLVACASPESEAQTVYITRTGAKYHDAYCQYLRKSKIPVTLSDALSRGYTACSVCDPPREVKNNNKSQPATPNSSSGKQSIDPGPKPVVKEPTVTKSRQCSASTKSGSRCRRMTDNANGKCWQHQ